MDGPRVGRPLSTPHCPGSRLRERGQGRPRRPRPSQRHSAAHPLWWHLHTQPRRPWGRTKAMALHLGHGVRGASERPGPCLPPRTSRRLQAAGASAGLRGRPRPSPVGSPVRATAQRGSSAKGRVAFGSLPGRAAGPLADANTLRVRDWKRCGVSRPPGVSSGDVSHFRFRDTAERCARPSHTRSRDGTCRPLSHPIRERPSAPGSRVARGPAPGRLGRCPSSSGFGRTGLSATLLRLPGAIRRALHEEPGAFLPRAEPLPRGAPFGAAWGPFTELPGAVPPQPPPPCRFWEPSGQGLGSCRGGSVSQAVSLSEAVAGPPAVLGNPAAPGRTGARLHPLPTSRHKPWQEQGRVWHMRSGRGLSIGAPNGGS